MFKIEKHTSYTIEIDGEEFPAPFETEDPTLRQRRN